MEDTQNKGGAGAVVARMKAHFGVKSDADLGRKLGIPKSTVSNWANRGSIPYEACAKMALEHGADLRQLVEGVESDERRQVRQLTARIAELEPAVREQAQASLVPPSWIKGEGFSQLDVLWRIIELLVHEGSASEERLQTALRMEASEVRAYCQQLYRQRVLKRTLADEWALAKIAVLRAQSDGDRATVSREALSIMVQRVIPGLVESKASLVVADVRIAGETPGGQVLQAMREALGAIEDDEGRLLKVVIGLALE